MGAKRCKNVVPISLIFGHTHIHELSLSVGPSPWHRPELSGLGLRCCLARTTSSWCIPYTRLGSPGASNLVACTCRPGRRPCWCSRHLMVVVVCSAGTYGMVALSNRLQLARAAHQRDTRRTTRPLYAHCSPGRPAAHRSHVLPLSLLRPTPSGLFSSSDPRSSPTCVRPRGTRPIHLSHANAPSFCLAAATRRLWRCCATHTWRAPGG